MHKSILGTLLLVVCALIATGCKSTYSERGYAPCVKENQQQLLIRWGTLDNVTQMEEYYTLDARGTIQRFSVKSADTARRSVAELPPDGFCNTATEVHRTFVKVQALNSPGTRARYIEYANPVTSVFLRAVWNPELNTFQSRDMRSLYETLMSLVPNK